MLTSLAQAFLLGLSVGPSCLGYCAPVCVPYFASQERIGWRASATALTLFLLGRLVGYSLVGAGVGLIGSQLLAAGPRVWGILRLALGLALLAFAFFTSPSSSKWCARIRGARSDLSFAPVIGLLTGLNLCPPFAAAIAGAAVSGSFLRAVLYFWFFFLGTSLYFGPLIVLGRLSTIEALRHVGRVCLILAATWFVLEGLFGLL